MSLPESSGPAEGLARSESLLAASGAEDDDDDDGGNGDGSGGGADDGALAREKLVAKESRSLRKASRWWRFSSAALLRCNTVEACSSAPPCGCGCSTNPSASSSIPLPPLALSRSIRRCSDGVTSSESLKLPFDPLLPGGTGLSIPTNYSELKPFIYQLKQMDENYTEAFENNNKRNIKS